MAGRPTPRPSSCQGPGEEADAQLRAASRGRRARPRSSRRRARTPICARPPSRRAGRPPAADRVARRRRGLPSSGRGPSRGGGERPSPPGSVPRATSTRPWSRSAGWRTARRAEAAPWRRSPPPRRATGCARGRRAVSARPRPGSRSGPPRSGPGAATAGPSRCAQARKSGRPRARRRGPGRAGAGGRGGCRVRSTRRRARCARRFLARAAVIGRARHGSLFVRAELLEVRAACVPRPPDLDRSPTRLHRDEVAAPSSVPDRGAGGAGRRGVRTSTLPPLLASTAAAHRCRPAPQQFAAAEAAGEPEPARPYDRAVQERRAARAERDMRRSARSNPLALEGSRAGEERHGFLATQSRTSSPAKRPAHRRP